MVRAERGSGRAVRGDEARRPAPRGSHARVALPFVWVAALASGASLGACSSTSGGAAPASDGGTSDAADAAANALCPGGVPAPYPTDGTKVSLLEVLPDMTFTGESGPVALHDYYEPCAQASRLLVVRVSAGWCGTCRWHAAHTKELHALDVAPRLEVLDLLVADDDNAPPDAKAMAAWRARVDEPEKIAFDPAFQLAGLAPEHGPLPLVALIDTRTMTVRNALSDPNPDLLALRVRQELAQLDKVSVPQPTPVTTFDGRFGREAWDMIHDMGVTPGAPPPDPSNAKADDAAAAALGAQFFSDTGFSPSGTMSCASCHPTASSFADGLPQSQGVAKVDRNAPSVLLAAHARWQFWDGRADSLWGQALGPPENAKEIGSTRLFVAHRLFDTYKTSYEAVFGALPPLGDTARFPASGKPGDAAYDALAQADKDAVTRAYVGFGKAIAAFERTIRVKPMPLDAYAAGDMSALTDAQKDGLKSFFASGCAECHYGPRLTDDAFHDVRFPTGRQDGAADPGRADGLLQLATAEFTTASVSSDAVTPTHATSAFPTALGAFKTPTLRGVVATAPYGHGGTLATLADVVKNYGGAGLPPDDPRAAGPSEPWLPKFDQQNQAALPAFLETLTAERAP